MATDTSHPSTYIPVYCGVGAPLIKCQNLFLHLLNLGLTMGPALARGAIANLCTVTCPLATFGYLHLPSCEQSPNSLWRMTPMTQSHLCLCWYSAVGQTCEWSHSLLADCRHLGEPLQRLAEEPASRSQPNCWSTEFWANCMVVVLSQ